MTTEVSQEATRPQGDRRDYLYEGRQPCHPPAPTCLLLPSQLLRPGCCCLYQESGRWKEWDLPQGSVYVRAALSQQGPAHRSWAACPCLKPKGKDSVPV